MMLKKIISGGQTGADRAGLAAGKALGLRTGGMMPKGCRTELGLEPTLMVEYGMTQSWSQSYQDRTEQNVREADGTVIFGNTFSVGSKLTITYCKQWHKPFALNPTPEELATFVAENSVAILNVAGNRESRSPGIFQSTFDTLMLAFGPTRD